MYGLEYALFFGVPENKMELIEGRGHWSFPFASRESAEAHYHAWFETLCRWKPLSALPPGNRPSTQRPPIHKSAEKWETVVGGIQMELYPRPIRFEIPVAPAAYHAFHSTFHRRDFWPGQPPGLEQGRDNWMDEGDVRMNLWKLLGDLCDRHGGQHSSRCDIAISDSAAVSPDAYYYRPGRRRADIMIEGDYFCAPPDLVAEVLSAPSRALDRGLRMEVYRRAGVEHLWLADPALETVDVYRLAGDYELQDRYQAGASFTCDLFPGETFAVSDLFATQSRGGRPPGLPDPIPEWLLPPDLPIGLEYFFYLGHPERRWEFWNNRAHSVLAFGSATEARARLDHFLTEASHWEGQPKPKPAAIDAATDTDRAELGRFQLTRRGRLVWLEIAIDGRHYKDLLRLWGRRECWDWGEK